MSTTLENEIDYMKALAQSGATGPLRDGFPLIWAGLIFGAASVVQYGFMTHLIPLPNPWFMVANWLLASLIFAVINLLHKCPHSPVPTQMAQASRSAWMGVVMAIMVFLVCQGVMAAQFNQLGELMGFFSPVILLFYGIGWWVSGCMSGQTWLKGVSVGCFIAAPLMAALARVPEQNLAYAVCLILFATLPGLRLQALAARASVTA